MQRTAPGRVRARAPPLNSYAVRRQGHQSWVSRHCPQTQIRRDVVFRPQLNTSGPNPGSGHGSSVPEYARRALATKRPVRLRESWYLRPLPSGSPKSPWASVQTPITQGQATLDQSWDQTRPFSASRPSLHGSRPRQRHVGAAVDAWQKRASRRAAACRRQQAFDVCRLTPRCSGRHPGAFAPGRRR